MKHELLLHAHVHCISIHFQTVHGAFRFCAVKVKEERVGRGGFKSYLQDGGLRRNGRYGLQV